MKKFAAFVMTYERESILQDTIHKIFSQTFPPEKILIVDNSISLNTEKLIISLNDPRVKYHRVGYNSGPAGAAAIGLRMLAEEGYEWIYWGDDDDPPFFDDVFEIVLKIAMNDPNCGCVGAVGQFFNSKTGIIKRVPNETIKSSGTLAVDTIAGGMSKIVSGPMILKLGIVPEEKLFFSFEDLDLDLKIKKSGYSLLVDKSLYWRHRERAGRTNYKRKYLSKKDVSKFWRNYYSTRNLLYICFTNKLFLATVLQFCIAFTKPFLNIKYGFSYFKNTLNINYLAVYHFFIGRYGFRKIN